MVVWDGSPCVNSWESGEKLVVTILRIIDKLSIKLDIEKYHLICLCLPPVPQLVRPELVLS